MRSGWESHFDFKITQGLIDNPKGPSTSMVCTVSKGPKARIWKPHLRPGYGTFNDMDPSEFLEQGFVLYFAMLAEVMGK